jgi:hypothetical protein
MILMGLVHIGFAFPLGDLDSYDFWFIGSGIAIILSGILNVIADCSPGGKVYITCSGLKEYHRQLLDKNYSYSRPGLENAPWGSPEMTIIDPFGNQLLFTEKTKSEEK